MDYSKIYIDLREEDEWLQKEFKNKDLVSIDDLINKIEDLKDEISDLKNKLNETSEEVEDKERGNFF